ncbi:MAG: hypothetical protein K2O11_05825 [Oscillospiraceae bacterium]|nr:hypothetical protein [Oscillospiraceae bacterium]
MKVKCAWEHNGDDTLLYAVNCAGAYARGANRGQALEKLPKEIMSYLRWSGEPVPARVEIEIVQEKASGLQIADADSDIIFEEERAPLPEETYLRLKALALKSAEDFHELYASVPDKNASCLPERNTFYGAVPRTAQEMYEHTKNVNSYYFGEIGVDADNAGTILECRQRGFALMEQSDDFLQAPAVVGSYDELWSVRKVLRRFIWHDRIHAKAMYRMAVRTFGKSAVRDPFQFDA